MAAFFEYLRNITYYLLFSTLLGMAAPSGKNRKYVTLITGLVLLLLMVQPLKGLPGGSAGIPVTEWFNSVTAFAGSSAGAYAGEGASANASGGDDAASGGNASVNYSRLGGEEIKAAFEERLFTQVEALLSAEGYVLEAAEFQYKEDFSEITGMDLTVQVPNEGIFNSSRPLIRIEPIVIKPKSTRESAAETGTDGEPGDANISRIKKLVTDFYAPGTPHINITINSNLR